MKVECSQVYPISTEQLPEQPSRSAVFPSSQASASRAVKSATCRQEEDGPLHVLHQSFLLFTRQTSSKIDLEVSTTTARATAIRGGYCVHFRSIIIADIVAHFIRADGVDFDSALAAASVTANLIAIVANFGIKREPTVTTPNRKALWSTWVPNDPLKCRDFYPCARVRDLRVGNSW